MSIIGLLFSGVAASLHVFFFYLESIAFPKSVPVQKLFLGKKADQKENVELVRSLLFNQGFYNLFLALGTFFGLATHSHALVRFTLWSYMAAGVVLFWSAPTKYKGAVAQIVPALIAAITL